MTSTSMGPLRAWSMGARWRSPQKPWPEAMRRDERPLRERDMAGEGRSEAFPRKLAWDARGGVEDRAKTEEGLGAEPTCQRSAPSGRIGAMRYVLVCLVAAGCARTPAAPQEPRPSSERLAAVVAAGYGIPPPPSLPPEIRRTVREEAYVIEGATVGEINASMDERSPFRGPDGGPHGFTAWDIRWEFGTVRRPTGAASGTSVSRSTS